MTSLPSDPSEWRFPNEATPPGSPNYYAVRFSPPAQRERNALLLAWYALIQAIADQPHDPGVARIKLDWWRGEIANLGRRAARHPLAVELQQMGFPSTALGSMQSVIDAADATIRAPRIEHDDAFVRACRGSLGNFFVLFAALDTQPQHDPRLCMLAGTYCDAVERIRRLAASPHRVPPELAPLALRDLPAAQRTRRLDRLLEPLRVDAQQAASRIPDFPRRLTALSGALHNKMRRTGYPVAYTLMDRAPIAHLWTAWRCR